MKLRKEKREKQKHNGMGKKCFNFQSIWNKQREWKCGTVTGGRINDKQLRCLFDQRDRGQVAQKRQNEAAFFFSLSPFYSPHSTPHTILCVFFHFLKLTCFFLLFTFLFYFFTLSHSP